MRSSSRAQPSPLGPAYKLIQTSHGSFAWLIAQHQDKVKRNYAAAQLLKVSQGIGKQGKARHDTAGAGTAWQGKAKQDTVRQAQHYTKNYEISLKLIKITFLFSALPILVPKSLHAVQHPQLAHIPRLLFQSQSIIIYTLRSIYSRWWCYHHRFVRVDCSS